MWWIIGALIGTAWNLHDEKKNPELRAKREKEARDQERGCLFVLLAVVAVIGIPVLFIEYASNSSTPGTAHDTHAPDAPITAATPAAPIAPLAVPEALATPKPETVVPSPQVAPTEAVPEVEPLPKPATLPEPSYQGKADTNFGKDWVIVDGVKMQGITFANPAPGGQVAIVYSDGGRNVPASSLPQGFLDAWKLTPEKFKAAGNQ
jgi:hypothetical protein